MTVTGQRGVTEGRFHYHQGKSKLARNTGKLTDFADLPISLLQHVEMLA